MICVSCLFRHGKDTKECKYCGNCSHVCRGCYRSKREKQLAPAMVYSQPQENKGTSK